MSLYEIIRFFLYHCFIPMKNNLQQLLNSLISRGWKPRWLDRIKWGIIYCWLKWWITFQHKGRVIDFCGADYVLYNWEKYLDYDSYMTHLADSVIVDTNHIFGYRKTLRELCSKESLLWQFVCENEMLETKGNVRIKNYWGDDECDDNCCDDDLEYWLMESSLIDEDKLEDFILSNIKVEWIS